MSKPQAQQDASLRTIAEQLEYEKMSVAAHYEHNPEIFKFVLDDRLAYSTGIFADGSDDLNAAQSRKFDYIKNELAVGPGDKVLDVGCGWGSNLLYLAENTGAQIHGVTLSEEQQRVALVDAKELGLESKVFVDCLHIEDLELQPESLDAVLFVGSIVHMHNREEIHQKVANWLKPGGRLLISDCYFPAKIRGDRAGPATNYIFVEALGYCRLLGLAEELLMIEQAGLDIVNVKDLTSSYVKTLGCWINNVRKHRDDIEEMSPGFSRVLQTYMSIARLSFKRRTALEYMITAVKG